VRVSRKVTRRLNSENAESYGEGWIGDAGRMEPCGRSRRYEIPIDHSERDRARNSRRGDGQFYLIDCALAFAMLHAKRGLLRVNIGAGLNGVLCDCSPTGQRTDSRTSIGGHAELSEEQYQSGEGRYPLPP